MMAALFQKTDFKKLYEIKIILYCRQTYFAVRSKFLFIASLFSNIILWIILLYKLRMNIPQVGLPISFITKQQKYQIAQTFIKNSLLYHTYSSSQTYSEQNKLFYLKQYTQQIFYNCYLYQILESQSPVTMSSEKTFHEQPQFVINQINQINSKLTPQQSKISLCQYYTYCNDGSQTFDNNFEIIAIPDSLCLYSAIPEYILEYYQSMKQNGKEKVNFLQGFIKSWGYIFYAVQKRLYLHNPCPQIFKQLHCNTKLGSKQSQPNNKLNRGIWIQIPDPLINIVETDMSIKQFSKYHKCNSILQDQQCKIVFFFYLWYVQIYIIKNKSIEDIWQLTEQKKQSIEINEEEYKIQRNRKYIPFQNLHIRYRLKCKVAHNIIFDKSQFCIYYTDKENVYQQDFFKVNLKTSTHQKIKKSRNILQYFGSKKDKDYQPILNCLKRSKCGQSKNIMSSLSSMNQQKYTPPKSIVQKINKICKQFIDKQFKTSISSIMQIINAKNTSLLDSTILGSFYCSKTNKYLSVLKIFEKNTNRQLSYINHHKFIIIAKSWQSNIPIEKYYQIQHQDTENSYPTKLFYCFCNHIQTQIQNHVCRVELRYNDGSYKCYQINYQENKAVLLKVKPIKIENISENNHKYSIIQQKQCTNYQKVYLLSQKEQNLTTHNLQIPQNDGYKSIVSSFKDTHQNYLYQYIDPSQVYKDQKLHQQIWQRRIFLHATDCGYQLFINMRKVDQTLCIIYQELSVHKQKDKKQIEINIKKKLQICHENEGSIIMSIITIVCDITGIYTLKTKRNKKISRNSKYIHSVNFSQLLDPPYENIFKFCMQYLSGIGQRYLNSCKLIKNSDINSLETVVNDRIFEKIQIYSAKTVQKASINNNKSTSNPAQSQITKQQNYTNILQRSFINYLLKMLQRYWKKALNQLEICLVIRQLQRYIDIISEINSYSSTPIINLYNFDHLQNQVSQFDDQNFSQQNPQTPSKNGRTSRRLSNKQNQSKFVSMLHQLIYFSGLICVSMPQQELKNYTLQSLSKIKKIKDKYIPNFYNKHRNVQDKQQPESENLKKVPIVLEYFHKPIFQYFIKNCKEGLQKLWIEVCPHYISQQFIRACQCYKEICPIQNRNHSAEIVFKKFGIQHQKQSANNINKFHRKTNNLEFFGQSKKNNDRNHTDKLFTQYGKQYLIICERIPQYFLEYLSTIKHISIADLEYCLKYKRQFNHHDEIKLHVVSVSQNNCEEFKNSFGQQIQKNSINRKICYPQLQNQL